MNHTNLRKKIVPIFLVLLINFFVVNILGQKKQTNVTPCNSSAQGGGIGNGLAVDYPYDEKVKYKPKIYHVGIKPLRITSKPMAKYTDEAKQSCVQGTVKLKITFFANGSVGNIKVLKGLDYGLSNRAIEAAKLIKFEPEIKNNKAVTVTKKVRYNFTIY